MAQALTIPNKKGAVQDTNPLPVKIVEGNDILDLVTKGSLSAAVVIIVDTDGNQIELSTEGKQDDLITELEKKANVTETQPVSSASLPLPSGAATSAKQDTAKAILDKLELNTNYPVGSGSNGSVTLTSANTAYAVPATASTKRHILVLYNGSDTDQYWGYQNTNANGILIPPDGRVSLNLGASQQVYAYCATAGKIIKYSFKEIS
jgi:hypothetical protein